MLVVAVACSDDSAAGDPTASASASAPALDERVVVELGGLERSYLVHVPAGIEEDAPLVVVLHGAGGSGEGAMREMGWDRKADEEGFIVVFPDASRRDPASPANFLRNPQVWNDGSGRGAPERQNVDDVAFIREIVRDIRERWSVDDDRIYVAGHSSGGSMAHRLGVEMAGEVAAIAAVSGHFWLEEVRPSAPVSVLYIVGLADPLTPIEGGEVSLPWLGNTDYHPPPGDTVAAWLRMDDCPGEGRTEDEGPVHTTTYGPCSGATTVEFVTIEGQGHAWPGGDSALPERLVGPRTDAFAATDEIWQFFVAHPRAG